MCFKDFIGYTCGHVSKAVLRPCPMTTALTTNAPCASPAERPTLARTMCPACERAVHYRRVLVREWEHRWMHERGACGCAVEFPDLDAAAESKPPRMCGAPLRRGEHFVHTDLALAGPSGGGAYRRVQGGGDRQPETPMHHHRGNNKAAAARNNSGRFAQNGRSDGGVLVAHGSDVNSARRTVTPATDDGGMYLPAGYVRSTPPPFRVVEDERGRIRSLNRLASVYAAEWVEDHRELHRLGKCACDVADFGFYRPVPLAELQMRELGYDNGTGGYGSGLAMESQLPAAANLDYSEQQVGADDASDFAADGNHIERCASARPTPDADAEEEDDSSTVPRNNTAHHHARTQSAPGFIDTASDLDEATLLQSSPPDKTTAATTPQQTLLDEAAGASTGSGA